MAQISDVSRGSDLRRVTWLRYQTCHVAQISDVLRGSDIRRVTWLLRPLSTHSGTMVHNGIHKRIKASVISPLVITHSGTMVYNGLHWNMNESERHSMLHLAITHSGTIVYNGLHWNMNESKRHSLLHLAITHSGHIGKHERLKASSIALPQHP